MHAGVSLARIAAPDFAADDGHGRCILIKAIRIHARRRWLGAYASLFDAQADGLVAHASIFGAHASLFDAHAG